MRLSYIATLCLAAILSLAACTDKKIDNKTSAAIIIERTNIEVEAYGGTHSINFEIQNPISGVLPYASTEADWIEDVECVNGSELRFHVLCNTSAEQRTAELSLSYPMIEEPATIRITQQGHAEAFLELELIEVEYSECCVSITSTEATMPYIVMMAEKEYFTAGNISNTEELISADVAFFSSVMSPDQSFEEFFEVSNFALYGDATKRWQDLSPAKEYIIYAYGIEVAGDDYRCTTPVYHLEIGQRTEELTTVEFDLSIECDGPEVSVEVNPKEWEGYYIVQFVEDTEAGFIPEGNPFDEDAERALIESFFYISDHLYYFEELTAEEVMQRVGHRGATTITDTLRANHKYMVLVYAIASVDGNVPMVVSHPEVEYLSTGSVERSDMTFEVEFSNILPRSVDITIIPSTSETYSPVMMFASNMPEGNAAAQLDYVVTNYAPLEVSGTYSEHIDQLPPDTEFILAIYGIYAGAPTTDLFVYSFKTSKDGQGGNIITAVNCSAYDLAEVAALEPYYASMMGYADYFLSMEVVTLTESPTLHFELYAKSQYDSYTHEAIRESLLEYAYTSSPDWALCTYGNEYIICGLAEDENGFVGEMYISDPISFTREQTSDAAIFVELYKEYVDARTTAKSMIFRD